MTASPPTLVSRSATSTSHGFDIWVADADPAAIATVHRLATSLNAPIPQNRTHCAASTRCHGPKRRPDGRSLIVTGSRNETERGIYRVNAVTGVASLLVPGPRPYAHVLSPDARTIYYATGSEPHVTVVARELGSGAVRTVRTIGGTVGQLKLSPEGRLLAVLTFWAIELVGPALGPCAAPHGATGERQVLGRRLER